MRWTLDALYDGFDGEAFQQDLKQCDVLVEDFIRWANTNLTKDRAEQQAKEVLEAYITRKKELFRLTSRLSQYAALVTSVETGHAAAKGYLEFVQKKTATLAGGDTRFANWLAELDNLEEAIRQSPLLEEHRFFLMEIRRLSRYWLSEKEEIVIAQMRVTGSRAWTKLHETLTAGLLVDVPFEGEPKTLPLTVVRNLAYDADPVVRKTAYLSELTAYGKIESAAAACLNNIKGEVITLAGKRGFSSPLEQALLESRMDSGILDAMMGAVRESLPSFRRYFQAKAQMLGHETGLPFFDIFAPVGSLSSRYSYQEARDYIAKHFYSFSERMAEQAFDKRWIDAEPRQGKVGGAFCNNLHTIKESRILSNFDGSFNSVITLAHELGHAYHGLCLQQESGLNSRYPMPIAETASTFCETIVTQAALQTAGPGEKLFILEKDLCGMAQVVVDIYSRFLFESELFRLRETRSLSVEELKELMLYAQKEAYGNGLDHNWLHPYAWIAKPHYYNAARNYYNFPYTFGLLLALGLYTEYRKHGKEFVPRYDALLAATGKNSLADVARAAGIDLYSGEFWRQSLAQVARNIETFVNLSVDGRQSTEG